MSTRNLAFCLLVCAFAWLSVQASLLFRAGGLLATYDLPTHLHLAGVQVRDPSLLWDGGWYAGYPTYAYPPLAHRFAAEIMRRMGVERGFVVAVAVVYVLSAGAIYAAARSAGGLTPVPAATATLLAALSPALFRTLLFGQYPSLMAGLLLWGVLAVLFGAVRAERGAPLLAVMAALLIGTLGSVHLFPLMFLPVLLAPILLCASPRRAMSRLVFAVGVGIILGLLPSLPFLADWHSFAKAEVPHITRTIEMVLPQGMLDWILAPAGLPMALGLLVLLPSLVDAQRGSWIGVAAASLLIFHLHSVLSVFWLVLAGVFTLTFALLARQEAGRAAEGPYLRYLCLAAVLSLWLSLGPAGGLARLLPFSDRLVYDRPLLFGAPLGYFAMVHALRLVPWERRRGVLVVLLLVSGTMLMGFSWLRVLAQYAVTPGAQGPLPQGTFIPEDVLKLLRAEGGFGRILPLGLPPIAYTLPDTTGRPLIDGAYNDARQLAPLRWSGLETLGYEKFTHADLRVSRYFLVNADAYGIRWIVTGDRYYERIVPFDRFALVLQSGEDFDRSIRVYRSINVVGPAWRGPISHRAVPLTVLPPDRVGRFGVGGGVRRTDRAQLGDLLEMNLYGSASHGWAFVELPLADIGGCEQVTFRAWSPTGATLVVRFLQAGRWTVARPEAPLPLGPATLTLGVDCLRTSRLQLAFGGYGLHQVFISPLTVWRVQGETSWLTLTQTTPECFRVKMPAAGAATVSLAYSPRWRPLDGRTGPRIEANNLGLLTLRGPPGEHGVCLAFPPTFRFVRTVLPVLYFGFSVAILGIYVLGGRRETAWGGEIIARAASIVTTIREVLLRRRVTPEQAWDARARTAPDWYAASAKSAVEAESAAAREVEELLGGVDLGLSKSWRVLEIGCGTGRWLKSVAPLVGEAYAVDISGEMVEIAQRRLQGVPNVFLFKNDGESLSLFHDNTFDFVFSVNVFQHIPRATQVDSYLREIHRVLKPGGNVKLQVDGRGDSLFWRFTKAVIGDDSWVGVAFSRREFVHLAELRGFQVLSCDYGQGHGRRWRRQDLWLLGRKPVAAEKSPERTPVEPGSRR